VVRLLLTSLLLLCSWHQVLSFEDWSYYDQMEYESVRTITLTPVTVEIF
jgi:hypothetical protein